MKKSGIQYGKWLQAGILSVPLSLALAVAGQAPATLGFSALGSASAQEDKKPASERETRRTPALRNKVYEKLAEAQAAAEAKDWREAKKVLNNMVDAGGKQALNSYELANVYNLFAFIAYSEEDYAGALRAYENVVKQPDIPLAMEINTKYTIAQLYFVQEQWQRGIDALLEWFEVTDSPNANAYILLAQGYYQTKDFNKALEHTNTAIGMYEAKGKVPKEQWYNLARFLYFEKNDVPNTVATLETLLNYYPKKQYWVQLSHMYGEQKKDSQQLAAMETAYVQDMLEKGNEQVTMAYLYLNAEVPYKAAKVLDKGLEAGQVDGKSKNYEILGNAWRQAQELDKAIPAMETAAEKSDDGELYARLGNVYLDNDEHAKAIKAINRGLQRGGVKRPDTARLILGMAYFNSKQYDKARDAFQAAARDDRSKTYAQQWMSYMNNELERQRKMEEGI